MISTQFDSIPHDQTICALVTPTSLFRATDLHWREVRADPGKETTKLDSSLVTFNRNITTKFVKIRKKKDGRWRETENPKKKLRNE
jgi:hypothetical protein